MNFLEFKKLDESGQCLLLWQHGVFLDERTDDKYKYRLYHVASFYVEEKWNCKTNLRVAIYAFNCMEYLEPYLEKIEIMF